MPLLGHVRRRGRSGVSVTVVAGFGGILVGTGRRVGDEVGGSGGWGQKVGAEAWGQSRGQDWRLGPERWRGGLEGRGEKSEAKAHAVGRVPSKRTV